MNRQFRRKFALFLGTVLLFTLVLSAAAGFDSFTLISGPNYSAPNYFWVGTATVSNPQKYVCIGFPDADPAVAPVHCPWTVGDGFNCIVPLSHFNNNLGQDLTWQIYAAPNTNCNGSTINATGPDNNGNITPTAVSLISFGAGTFPNVIWPYALVALALFTGVIVIVRRIVMS